MAEFTEEEEKRLNDKGFLEDEAKIDEKNLEAEAETEEKTEIEEENKEEDAQSEQDDEPVGKTLDELAAEEQSEADILSKNIFDRLSKETEELFKASEAEHSVDKTIRKVKKTLGLTNPQNIKVYSFLILIFFFLFSYYARFEIVRKFPSVE